MHCEALYLGAYWGVRDETLEVCADRLTACLGGLARLDRRFGAWYETGRTKTERLRAVDVTGAGLTARLLRGRNRRDDSGEVIAQLGSTISIWNGERDSPIGLSVRCGNQNPRLTNSLTFDVPPAGSGASAEESLNAVMAMVEVVVQTVDPDWAVVTSSQLRRTIVPKNQHSPVAGLVTYVRNLPQIKTPPGATRSPLGESGSVVVVDPQHLGPDLLHRISQVL